MRPQSQEDYLRAIYYIYEKTSNKKVNSVEVASYLVVSKAAVSKMLKKLVKQKLIKMQPYSSFSFTVLGLRQAKILTRKHRIIEVFLVDVLKIKPNQVHEEAHKLEHAFSDRSIKKLAKFLNNPKFCPGGKRIPVTN